ncbi:MAG TPA: PIN domain-containing protein [Fimbriimonas sp.]|nr:PIN domain-containing protein [Fimbriimonas sp.]
MPCIYLDTSVFSAYHDERDPGRLALTQEFWKVNATRDLCTSDVTVREIGDASSQARRSEMLALVGEMSVFATTRQAETLAEALITEGAFSPRMFDDALHVANAVIGGCEVLVSWNFKHLVNRTRRVLVNHILMVHGYRPMEFVAPPEI